jgi:formylglycine-generating enzyme required for sulfatase activity
MVAADEKNPAAAGGTPLAFERYVEKIPGTLVEFEMLPVPAGSIEYTIGKGEPQRADVKRFWIGRTEVTFDEFDIFRLGLDIPDAQRAATMGKLADKDLGDARTRPSPAYGDPSWGFGQRGYPALSLSYFNALRYCEWLSQRTGKKYRLPTEVEWEYACRAGAAGKPTRQELDALAWHEENSPTEEHALGKTHPVARKRANAWGIHDMLGNAWEWCTGVDGKPVARGGAWNSRPATVHPGARFTKIDLWSLNDSQYPKSRFWHTDGNCIGFRIVCEE